MGKKQVAVSLRKPPPADPDAFVAGAAEAPATVVMSAPKAAANENQVVATRVGERRELTVYLPLEVAKQLSVRCLELDRDVSNVVAEALEKALTHEEPPAELEVKVHVRPNLLSRVRGLVDELRGRIPLLGII
jgi:hypothetical protein